MFLEFPTSQRLKPFYTALFLSERQCLIFFDNLVYYFKNCLGGIILEFINTTHKNQFNSLIERDKTHPEDSERKSLFFIISGSPRLFNIVDEIYDTKNHTLILDSFDSLKLSSSEEGLLELALNLFNNYSHQEGEMKSIHELFKVLDDNNFELALFAIRTRYNK